MMAGQDADAETIEKLRRELGLDRPILSQYVTYMGKVFRGDLGMSLKSKLPVFNEIALRYPPTMILAVAGMAWSVLFGVFFGAIAAIYSGKWQDYTAMIVSVSGISIPQFWLGLLLIQFFSVYLGWLPVTGYTGKLSELSCRPLPWAPPLPPSWPDLRYRRFWMCWMRNTSARPGPRG